MRSKYDNNDEDMKETSNSVTTAEEPKPKQPNGIEMALELDERATLAEKEVSSLKEQLANHSTREGGGPLAGGMAPPPPDREDTLISGSGQDFELAAKDKEIASLVEDVQRLQASISQIRDSTCTKIRHLEDQLDQKSEFISKLEARLDSQKDYEEVKRELHRLKGSSSPCPPDNSSVNGLDAKDIKDKRPSSPSSIQSALQNRFLLGPGGLPVEAFGSLLGEEIVSTWRKSLERSLLVTSPPLHHQHHHQNIQHHQNRGDRNESCSPPPPNQYSPLGDTCLNDSNLNSDHSPLNGNSERGGLDRDRERMPFRFEDSLIPKSDPMEARLQEMLRYNMDAFGSQCLDTLQISRRVRELLSIHNIGQRLFAKYVLGLSQGTVSELLSKPKPWDKLTEKGRDSYRKMHAWAADEASVLLLKSLIPKKGKEGSGSLSSYRCGEESGADDRIAHILSEANHALHRGGQHNTSVGQEGFNDENTGSKSPMSNEQNGSMGNPCPPSPTGSLRRLRKYENDDISQEQVSRIYQEELAKLVGLRLPHAGGGGEPDPRLQSLLFPHLFGGSLLERDDIRMALDAYHRELAKLAANNSSSSPSPFPPLFHPGAPLPNGLGGGHAQDLSLPKRLTPDTKDVDEKNEKEESSSSSSDVIRHMGSAFSLVRPKCESNSGAPSPLNQMLGGGSGGGEDSSNASPLQRMASITNSLISQPTTPSISSPSQRPLKAVLPPITQQQFDQYNNLNTEDIVRKVKEQLSQYSISQRLFGESVLGLSQGSVSDLLARPKPWHMLTQKGREPFIRMKMFLEDENAVHKLVASQYKIAPEKLMRTGGYSGNPCMPYPLSPPTPTKAPPGSNSNSNSNSNINNNNINSINNNINSSSRKEIVELPMKIETSPLPPPLPPLTPQQIISQQQQQSLANLPIHDLVKKSPASATHHHRDHRDRERDRDRDRDRERERDRDRDQQGCTPSPVMLNRSNHPANLPQQPSVYEMAALTQDLDTQLITTKIKEALLANNIGQKIFGEVVLGLSQGSVSELLSKPKPWHMLSIKGREPFIRMQLWLADSLNVERLQHLKNERREANKRKRGLHSSSPLEGGPYSGAQGSSDASNDSPNESYSPGSSSAAAPPSKKQRVLFSDEQKEALRLAFALDPYPNVSAIEFLARELGLSSRTITNWFHNHRMRLKQQTSSPLIQDTPLSSQPFDPVQFRVLLHQRLLDLHKDKYQVLPFLGQGIGNSHHHHRMEEGLDLTVSNVMSRGQSDNDDDFFEEEEDDDDRSIGSDDSGGSSKEIRRRGRSPMRSSDIHQGKGGLSLSGGSSRRKPVAPQWFNPSSFMNENEDSEDDDERVINGVCVLQNNIYGSDGKKQSEGDPLDLGAEKRQTKDKSQAVIKREMSQLPNSASDHEDAEDLAGEKSCGDPENDKNGPDHDKSIVVDRRQSNNSAADSSEARDEKADDLSSSKNSEFIKVKRENRSEDREVSSRTDMEDSKSDTDAD